MIDTVAMEVGVPAAISAGVAFLLLFRKREKPVDPDPDASLRHRHVYNKKGEDGVYFCLSCGDRYLDGKPKK